MPGNPIGVGSVGSAGGSSPNIFDIFVKGQVPAAGIRASYPGSDGSWTARGFQTALSANASVLLPLSADANSGWKFTIGTVAPGTRGNSWTLRTTQRTLAAPAVPAKKATYAWHYRTDGGTRRYINVTADVAGLAGNSRRFNVIARAASDQYLQNGNDYDIRIRTNGTMPAHEFLTAANAAFTGITFTAGTDYAFSGGIAQGTTAPNYQNLAGGANVVGAVAAGSIGFSSNLSQRRLTLIYDASDTLTAIRAAIAATLTGLARYVAVTVQGTVVEATATFGAAGGADLNFAGGVNAGVTRVEADQASKFIDVHYDAAGTLAPIFAALEAKKAGPIYRGAAVGTSTPEAIGWVRSVGAITAEAGTGGTSSGPTLTNPQVKTKYEANPNTNPFTDSEKTKLASAEANATADQTGTEIVAELSGLSGAARLPSSAVKDLPSGSGDAIVDLGLATISASGFTTAAPGGRTTKYPSGTILLFEVNNPYNVTPTDDVGGFTIGTVRYDFYQEGASNITRGEFEVDTSYMCVVSPYGHIQLNSPYRRVATTASKGLLSSADKIKLDGVEALKAKLAGIATDATAVSVIDVLAKIFAGTGINIDKATAGQITISATGSGSGGTADGVVKTGTFDEATQIVTLTTSLGGTVTVNLGAFVIATELTAALAGYTKADGTVAFTAPVAGVTPTANAHLATKKYADDADDLKASLLGATFTGAVKGIDPAADKDFVTLSYFNTHKNISPVADDIYFGISDDAVATGPELTIAAVAGVGTILAYVGNKHQLIARLATEADITTVFYSDDPTNLNAIGVFTKQVAKVTPVGETAGTLFNVWVSDQALINRADVILRVA